MVKDFEFENAGRTFICSIETPRHAGMPPWWFFCLSTLPGTRYAPFEAKASDTRQSVELRIVKHYEEVLAIKARPVHPRPQWQRPVRPAVTPTTPEAAVAVKA